MTDETNGAAAPQAAPEGQQVAPQMRILSQFTRDLSFENPMAGQPMQQRPEIEVGINVDTQKMTDDRYLVALKIKASAKINGAPAFVTELDYAGVFLLQNIPDNALHAVMLIECPRQLFPFARRIVADASRDGGYPPLLLDPVDFAALYRQQFQKQQAQPQAPNA